MALGIVASSAVEGQTVFRLPAQTGGRQAAQPMTRSETSPDHQGPVYGAPTYPRYPVAYTVLPAIIMSDGSIYANFGHGYVPVRQSCVSASRVLGSNGPLHSNATPPTYTQPVPNQATASQQMARGQTSPARYPAQYVNACYRMDAYGPVVIVR